MKVNIIWVLVAFVLGACAEEFYFYLTYHITK